MTQGSLIVFEGPDGVGKSTLALKLVEYFRLSGKDCDYLTFPGNTKGTLGQHIYELHHHPEQFGIEDLNPTSLQLLHIAAHIEAIEHEILPRLRAGMWVVLDRFWWSTLAYGKAGNANHLAINAALQAEKLVWGGVKPTAVFLLARGRSGDNEKIDMAWQRLNAAYYELADEESVNYPVYTINNDVAIETTLEKVVGIIEQVSLLPAQPQSSPEKVQLRFDLPKESFAPLQKKTSLTVFSRLSPAEPTEVLNTYWYFATERQAIFFRRVEGQMPPWTKDPILAHYKFTNAYRASDRVSQYLIKHVIFEGDDSREEVFFRILLFKIFNRIETWELLQNALGSIRFSEYSFEKYDAVLSRAMAQGSTIFSAAYIMPSGKEVFGFDRKHRNYLKLLERMMGDKLPAQIQEARTMGQAFDLVHRYPLIGNFLAYQYIIDLNYSNLTHFSEMDFVMPGPGARNGIRKCFRSLGGLNETDIIRLIADRQEEEFERLGLNFHSLWGRRLQLIDCQNLFCEVDKYARIAHPEVKGVSDRRRIKQTYQGSSPLPSCWYPPKWGLNNLIQLSWPAKQHENTDQSQLV